MPTRPAATRVRALRLLTITVLMLGYADLASGGITLAPVLLVASYLALVPLALLAE